MHSVVPIDQLRTLMHDGYLCTSITVCVYIRESADTILEPSSDKLFMISSSCLLVNQKQEVEILWENVTDVYYIIFIGCYGLLSSYALHDFWSSIRLYFVYVYVTDYKETIYFQCTP